MPQALQLSLDPPELIAIDILKPLKDFFGWLVSQLVNFMSSMAILITENVVLPILSALKWVFDKASGLITSTISSLVDFTRGLAPVTPERAFENIGKLLLLVASGSVAVGGLFTALNIKVAGTGLDTAPLSHFFERMLRPELVTGLVIGTILGVGFRTPLTYWANNTFRPNLPRFTDAYSMFVKGIISESTLNYVMRYQGGWSEDWLNAWKRHLTYTPRPFEIMRLADYTSLDPIWISKKLSDVGMEEWDKTKYLDAIIKRPLREEVRALVYEIGTNYIYGWISEADCRSKLVLVGIKPEEVELTMSRLIYVRKRTLLNDRIEIYKLQYRKDLITLDTLIANLKALGLAEENINLIVAYEKAYKGILN
jgi:hypothetical protein